MGKSKVSIGVRLVQILAFIWNVWIEATTLSVLWAWFAVPVGLPGIGKAHAYGLALIIALATARWRFQEDETDERVLQFAVWLAVTPPMFLLSGYIAHRVMLP